MNDIPTDEYRQVEILLELRMDGITWNPKQCVTGYRLQRKWLAADGQEYMAWNAKNKTDIATPPIHSDGPHWQPTKPEWRDVPIVKQEDAK